MKRFKLICLIMMVFALQASLSAKKIQLLKKEDSISETEGIIIFNLYYLGDSIRSVWKMNDENSIEVFYDNYLSSKKIKQKYVVAKVSAGTYYLSLCAGELKYFSFTSPKYISDTTPLTFTIKPGEVKYLGDIELVLHKIRGDFLMPILGPRKLTPVFIIHNRFDGAKKFMQEKHPSLVPHLVNQPIWKTKSQLILEQKYSSSDNSTLLKEISHAH